MDSSSGIGKIEVACRVCGDKASGKHYGVPSCDGCRGFFKRSIRRNLDYVCKENNRCIVDVTRRNQCQACRFSKCLRVNMKKDAVQHERAPRTCIPSHAQMTFNGSGFYGPSRRLSVPVHASPLTISPSLTLSMPPNHAALVAPFQAISQMPVLPGHLSQVEGPASSQHDFHHLSQTHPHLFNSPTAFGHMSFGLNHLFGASGFATLKNASNFEMNTLGGVRSNTFVAGHLPYSIGETTHFPSSILHQPLIDNFPTGHNSSNPVNSNPPKSSSENCKTQENRASEYTAKEDEVTSSEESNKALGKITNSIEDTPASNAFAIHSSTNEKRNQHTDDTFTVQNIMKSIPRNFEKHLQSICDRENILKQANKLCDIFRQSNISKDDEMTSSIGENIYESSAKLLFLSVKWAKTVPSFLQLKNVDQKVLLSSTWKELFVLTAAQCALPSVTSQLCKRRGTLSSSLQSDASRLDDLMKQMDNMKIDHSEYSFLKAAILFQPDAVNGDMKQLVEMLQDQTLTMLLDYCVKYKTPTRAGRLLLMLPSVICLAKHGRIEELLFKDTVGNIAIENILTEIDTYKQP